MGCTTELITGANGARVVVSISRPSGCEEMGIIRQIESYYTAVSDSLKCSARLLADRKAQGELYKIFLTFDVKTDDGKLVLSSKVRVVNGFVTLFDRSLENKFKIIDGRCLKKLKNSRNQRFIPLRNAKNIINCNRNKKNPTV